MKNDPIYDCAIIGGGLGGLTLAINLAKKGCNVVLLEKEQYPFHKVCGEYISMESSGYLQELGFPLDDLQLPVIKKLVITSAKGHVSKQLLPLGGFGISRFKIDGMLKTIAVQAGVTVIEQCKVEDVVLKEPHFLLTTSKGNIEAKVCCGSYGKRSNIDVKWKRDFVQQPPNKLNNYIAVKYHIQIRYPDDVISLHNFKDGYCGISKIEDDKYCLCYLTNAANLKESNNSIEAMEENILSKNPYLRRILDNAIKLYTAPLSISQISFDKKKLVEQHVLMIGDAAGLITPLCGNGMSMAMHAGKIAAAHIDLFLKGSINRIQMEKAYEKEWNKTFAKRLRTGRIIQGFFGKEKTTNFFLKAMNLFPFLAKMLIRQTHGKPF